ncbi:MAG: aminopeptidase N [Pseudomonadota bacterium]
MRTDLPQKIHLKDYRPPSHWVETVSLDVALHPTETRVRATLRMVPNTAPEAPNGALVLDGDGLTLKGVSLDGAPLTDSHYAVTPDRLEITAPPAQPFTLEIETLINPSANTALMGLYRSNNAYCTQCEAEGFRRITYFPDRPDVMAVYTVRLEAEKDDAPILLSNGNPIERGDISGTTRHFAIWHDPFPKPSYLFAMVGGDLARVSDSFTTMTGKTVDLGIYVEHGKEDRCAYAMDALKRSMRWDEETFGRTYELDVFNIVAVSDFNMGAMENTGLNIFNDKYVLAKPETATDQDYANIETVIAHEYFHHWTGNRITCRDWFQLCLKEGLTVFRDQEFSSDMRDRAVKRIEDVRTLRARQFPEDAGPLAHPVRPESYMEINNFYTATVYEKGAEIVRMVKTMIGDDAFRAGMDRFFADNDGRAATVEDFVAAFETASDTDLNSLFNWYRQAGTPDVTVEAHHDPANSRYTLSFNQTTLPTPEQDEKSPVPIPIRLGLIGADGRALPLDGSGATETVVLLSDTRKTVTFDGISERPIPSLLRRFSAPVRLTGPLSPADLKHLAAHDTDAFNRWQAVQDIVMDHLKARVSANRRDAVAPLDQTVVDLIGGILRDTTLGDAYRALLLTLPSEADMARELRRDVDPEAIHQARAGLRKDLAEHLGSVLETAYASTLAELPTTFSADARSAGKRSLLTAILALLSVEGNASARGHAMSLYWQAGTMTERVAALQALLAGGDGAAKEPLADFYKTFEDDNLVLDKWFTLQAASPADGTLDHVRALMEHPKFSFATPNRVRALVGAFTMLNQRQFNRADGAGFALLAEVVLRVDPDNPQLAARLLAALRSWRSLETGRQKAAQQTLALIAEQGTLSKDVRDILDRTRQS